MKSKIRIFIIILAIIFYLPVSGWAAHVDEIKFPVSRFVLEGELPCKEDEIHTLLLQAQGKVYNLKQIQQLAQQVETMIREEGYAFYRVIVPSQALMQGLVTFKLIEFTLGQVKIKDNVYFDEANIRRSLPTLTDGLPINTRTLASALKFANSNESKQVKLTFKQSQVADQVDADITVTDERPYHVSLIFNNAGTLGTGDFRLTAALQHNNVWNWDHVFNASYTTSPGHVNEVIQYGFRYQAPIYRLKGWLTGYYTKSSVNTGVVAGGFDVSGSGEMYGFHYLQYLPQFQQYAHWFDIGIDNHLFDNNIIFARQNIGTSVRSVPFSLLYKAEIPWNIMQFNFNIQWLKNINIGSYNSRSSYFASRTGAREDWDVLRYGVNIQMFYQEWLLKVILSGQYSDEPLISGEQIGLGGPYSVRGYQGRESSADSGDVLHIELYTPRWFNISFLTFFDYGHGKQQSTLPGEIKEWDLSSLGIGARWQWQKYVFASIDWAFALNDAPNLQTDYTQAGSSRIHGSLTLRY